MAAEYDFSQGQRGAIHSSTHPLIHLPDGNPPSPITVCLNSAPACPAYTGNIETKSDRATIEQSLSNYLKHFQSAILG
jgi:hypothetical protein